MKRGRIAEYYGALPTELQQLIGAQVYEPWFTDLRAFLRWHQCSRAHWKSYVAL